MLCDPNRQLRAWGPPQMVALLECSSGIQKISDCCLGNLVPRLQELDTILAVSFQKDVQRSLTHKVRQRRVQTCSRSHAYFPSISTALKPS
jgi:hypothetical protein